MSLEPIGPVRPAKITLETIPPLGLGGATFSTQYNPEPDDETTLPVQAILRRALSLGINLIDTSPYYGNSEIVLGKALRKVWEDGWEREGMFICTKAGRIRMDEFDYDPRWMRKSVARSCERLGVEWIDVVYCHDVEFVTDKEALDAINELFSLKDKGKIRNVGVSGLPVDVLVERAESVKKYLGRPLDIILSYSNMTLQNTSLKAALPRFHAAGVKRVLTASPLSMGLLRSAGPQTWHPASQPLKDACIRARDFVEGRGENLADTSMRFLFANWDEGIVGGWSSIKELEDAVRMWHRMKSGVDKEKDEALWRGARQVMGDQVDTMWPSPAKGWIYNDGTQIE